MNNQHGEPFGYWPEYNPYEMPPFLDDDDWNIQPCRKRLKITRERRKRRLGIFVPFAIVALILFFPYLPMAIVGLVLILIIILAN